MRRNERLSKSHDFIILRGVLMNYAKKKPVVLIYAKNCLDSVIILDRITEALYTSFHTRIFLLHIDFLLYSAITLNLMTYYWGTSCTSIKSTTYM